MTAKQSFQEETERPIEVSHKSFEELVNDRLKNPDFQTQPTDTPLPKKKMGVKTSSKSDVPPEFTSDMQSDAIVQKDTNGSKPKFPFLKRGSGTKRFNCGKLTLKKGMNKKPNREQYPVEDSLTLVDSPIPRLTPPTVPPSIDSPLQRRREMEELLAFEKLEELAEDTSFCSSTSTVNSLLQKGLDKCPPTPLQSPVKLRRKIAMNDSPLSLMKPKVNFVINQL